MPRTVRLLRPEERGKTTTDTLILTYEQRRSQEGEVLSSRGAAITLDRLSSTALQTDDVVLLDNGELAEVVAAAEPLTEVRADVATLARLAWALGDRHIPAQILPNRIRFARDPTLSPLMSSVGCKGIEIDAPFDPEGGAYATHGHDHAHNHDHHHGQDSRHGHHHHGHPGK